MNKKLIKGGKKLLGYFPYGNQLVSYLKWKIKGIYKCRHIPTKAGVFYETNPEIGTINIEVKMQRVASGGIFEHLDMIATNKAIGQRFLTSDIHRVVNIGSGVGTFENVNALQFPDIQFLASEMDVKSTKWTIANRSFPNVRYCTDTMTTILNAEAKFDLAVTIDVIEHVADYKSFLDEFALLADKAVIATPNRDRNCDEMRKPRYKYHVQEFNAGELYFILKMYYRRVELFSAPNIFETDLIPVGLYSSYEKLFAYCEK